MVRERRLGPRGFWDDFKDEIESAHRSLAAGGGAAYQLFAQGWFAFGRQSYSETPALLGSPSLYFGNPFGVPLHELQEALEGPFPHSVIFTAREFLEEIIHRIKNAADWKALDLIARPLIGPYSLHAGILYGLGESLVGDAVGLLGLAKLVVLAGLYERIKHPAVMVFSDPMTLALTIAVKQIGSLNREAKAADEQLWRTLDELKEIARHPIKFIEIVGQDSWKGVVKDWNDLKYATSNPSVSHDFAAGRILGRALYQIVIMILLVLSVAGVAVKLAARFPWLMRLARIISRGGKLEELEDIRQGVRALREGEAVPTEPSQPQEPPEEKPPDAAEKARLARRNELAKDPAHGGKVTPKTLREADVAMDLESEGRLTPTVTRDPTGGADFIDGKGTDWDVKQFNSNFPADKGGFDLVESISKIMESLRDGENVIVDTANMSPADLDALKQAVQTQGLGDRVIFYP